MLLALLLAGGSAAAAETRCSDSAIGELVADGEALRVVAPGPSGLRAGDALLQLNGHRLQGCSHLKAALAEARERNLNALLLVGRGSATETVALSLEDSAEDSTPPVPRVAVAEPERRAVPTVAVAAMNDADAAMVRQMVQELLDLGRALQARLPLLTAQPWVKRIDDLRDAYQIRRQQTPAVGVAAGLVGSYQTLGEILLYKQEAARAAGRRALQPGMTFEFTSDSRVGAWLRRYPYIEASVVQPPAEVPILARGERAGRWSPDTAVRVLLEHVVAEGVAIESASAR